MRIRFDNGLVLGSGDYQIEAPLSGLDTPAIRNGSGVYAGADGGFFVSQYYGMRTITIKGFFIGCSSELRQNLLSKLYMRYYSSLTIEDFKGDCWFTQGYVTDVKCDIVSPKFGQFQITITCPDPAIYQAESFLSEQPIIITTDLVLNGSKTVLRQGDMDAYPVITLTGKFTNPRISIGDYSFSLGITTAASDVITIDMKRKRVLDRNGESLAEDRTTDSKWLFLGIGANEIQLETDSNSDTGTATMTYSAGYRGI